ncbi:MAG: alkaline phosphatase D family protein [Bacteroidota bacterium]
MKSFLPLIFLLGLLAACQPTSETHAPWTDATQHLFEDGLKPFYHGVASGDPLQDAVILWTRVTPIDSLPEIEVRWEVSTSEEFELIAAQGTTTTDPGRDYTVKVDAQGLEPGTAYFYRFHALDATSMTGRTRTAPTASEQLKFAVVSCSNYEFGYFNAYGALAARTDLDAILHLGDYIYEYGQGVYGDTTIGRLNLPAKELVALSDYRTRYSQYRLDPDLRAAHANHPFINIWDDHEIANDAYQDGAQNHQEDEGPFETRRSAAVQTYYEWIPIREGKHYRTFGYGDLAEVIMLDERLAGRTAPADSLTDPRLQAEDRSMLGAEQLAWLQNQLTESNAQWKVIGNQVIFSYLNWGFEPNFTINLDSWDGYPQEQKALADFIREQEIKDLVFVTGDTHTSWAFEASVSPFENYNAATSEGAIAIEFGTTSINSGNTNDREGATDSLVMVHEQRISNSPINPHLKFVNMRDHGYLLLQLEKEKARAEWHYVGDMSVRNPATTLGKAFEVQAGTVKLLEQE